MEHVEHSIALRRLGFTVDPYGCKSEFPCNYLCTFPISNSYKVRETVRGIYRKIHFKFMLIWINMLEKSGFSNDFYRKFPNISEIIYVTHEIHTNVHLWSYVNKPGLFIYQCC
jgi:hypothetical protein